MYKYSNTFGPGVFHFGEAGNQTQQISLGHFRSCVLNAVPEVGMLHSAANDVCFSQASTTGMLDAWQQ